MSKYEIMIILDPKTEISQAETFFKTIFPTGINSFVKMDRTDLAYEINKSSVGTYVLVKVETAGENIAEFQRKVNMTKWIWRELVINLDSERGLNGKPFNAKFNKWKKRTPRPGGYDRRNGPARREASRPPRKAPEVTKEAKNE